MVRLTVVGPVGRKGAALVFAHVLLLVERSSESCIYRWLSSDLNWMLVKFHQDGEGARR